MYYILFLPYFICLVSLLLMANKLHHNKEFNTDIFSVNKCHYANGEHTLTVNYKKISEVPYLNYVQPHKHHSKG